MFTRAARVHVLLALILFAGMLPSTIVAKPPDLPFHQKDVCLEKAAPHEIHSERVADHPEPAPTPASPRNDGAPSVGFWVGLARLFLN
jgi:hypothetical protein